MIMAQGISSLHFSKRPYRGHNCCRSTHSAVHGLCAAGRASARLRTLCIGICNRHCCPLGQPPPACNRAEGSMSLLILTTLFHMAEQGSTKFIELAFLCFSMALLKRPDYALMIGVIISLMLFMENTMHPRIIRISIDPKSGACS